MFDLVNGLPVHPLVVHAVVVLLPLAIVGTILVAVRPTWRRAYGPLVVVASALSVVLIPVATSSGEALEKHVGDPGAHAHLGDQLIWFAIPLLILNVLLVAVDRVGAQRVSHRVVAAIAAVSVLAALGAGVQVYRVGDSGARAAWADRVTSTK
ncbi:MAG TPA: hypothetical protein P5108_09205 [Marmoricola sp.]|jgi:uncharacterized membrane protein|nr:hypothetical protein [Nocardioidaceae bacterium]HMU35779.1 hypothetical protein [Marmoricola sp.]MCB8992429.1 hypothetical protein [Nocardioidaceae bacterium]MCO5323218.1 hypothetical protein [Nocardioidaceae bacterium]HMY08928.1 hypothetical protein [Marmoricola sp.]